jgi:hypothetical protein
MFSTAELKNSLCHFLVGSKARISFAIEQHQCELIKVNQGINCLISIDAENNKVAPDLLSRLTQIGANQFPGKPILGSDEMYWLEVWQPLSKASDTNSEKLMAIIEILANQAAVWNEMLNNFKPNKTTSAPNDMLKFATRLSKSPSPF